MMIWAIVYRLRENLARLFSRSRMVPASEEWKFRMRLLKAQEEQMCYSESGGYSSQVRCQMINLNKLACQIAEKEGKKISLSIAQIKEVLRITLDLLSKEKSSEVLRLLGK